MTVASWDFSEFRAFAADLSAASGRAEALAETAVAKTAAELQGRAQSAAPVDTGYLRGSISSDIRGLEAEIGPTAHYGIYLEMGTSRMAPRPFLFPALDAVEPGFLAAMEQVIDGSLQ